MDYLSEKMNQIKALIMINKKMTDATMLMMITVQSLVAFSSGKVQEMMSMKS